MLDWQLIALELDLRLINEGEMELHSSEREKGVGQKHYVKMCSYMNNLVL